jgi:gluconate 2-dehydrogenase gamma chain
LLHSQRIPMKPGHASRRQFLLGSASGLSSAWLALRWPAVLAAQAHAQHAAESGQLAPFQFFSAKEAVEIEAMAAQIIPDDDAPGARAAHVIYFIDRVLTTFDHDKQPAYRQGLKDLHHKTLELFPSANRFSSLPSAQQIQLLTAVETTDFFELVRVHTIMGYLSRPEYGGNHDQAGWKLIGFEDEMTFEPPFGYYDSEYGKDR